jgi:hypothetical protein
MYQTPAYCGTRIPTLGSLLGRRNTSPRRSSTHISLEGMIKILHSLQYEYTTCHELYCTFVGSYTDCKIMHSMGNVNHLYCLINIIKGSTGMPFVTIVVSVSSGWGTAQSLGWKEKRNNVEFDRIT